MSESKPKGEFKELFELARNKKYLTYDEINEHMPAHIVGPAQIDELLVKMMTDFDIELVASDKKIPVSEKKARKIDEEKVEEEEEEELAADP